MIEIHPFIEQFSATLLQAFGDRVYFIGLQGSYGRGEATQTSDIDLVVILDELSASDIITYNAMLDTLPHRELICGFLAGKNELLHWEPYDLFQLYYDTTPIRGSLDELLPLLDDHAVTSAIRIGACNIFHGCVHNMLYEKSEDILKGLYKAASFVVQAICFRQTGNYIRHQKDLLPLVSDEEAKITETFMKLKSGGSADFQAMSETLLNWTQKLINGVKPTAPIQKRDSR